MCPFFIYLFIFFEMVLLFNFYFLPFGLKFSYINKPMEEYQKQMDQLCQILFVMRQGIAKGPIWHNRWCGDYTLKNRYLNALVTYYMDCLRGSIQWNHSLLEHITIGLFKGQHSVEPFNFTCSIGLGIRFYEVILG